TDQLLSERRQRDPLDPAVAPILLAADDAALHKLVDQATGRRQRASEIVGEIADSAATLRIQQHQRGELRDRDLMIGHRADGIQEAVTEDGPPQRRQAVAEGFEVGRYTIHDTDDTAIVAQSKVPWVTLRPASAPTATESTCAAPGAVRISTPHNAVD